MGGASAWAASHLHVARLQAADWSCELSVQVSRCIWAVVDHRSVDTRDHAAVLWRVQDAKHLRMGGGRGHHGNQHN